MNEPARRTFLRMLGAGAGLAGLGWPAAPRPRSFPSRGVAWWSWAVASAAQSRPSTFALFDPALEVVLVERNRKYVASPSATG